MRADPPQTIAGQAVAKTFDFMDESASTLPATNLLRFTLADGARVLARPSGTEPKLKFYFEVVGPLGETLAAGEAAADARLKAVMDDFLGQVNARFGI